MNMEIGRKEWEKVWKNGRKEEKGQEKRRRRNWGKKEEKERKINWRKYEKGGGEKGNGVRER